MRSSTASTGEVRGSLFSIETSQMMADVWESFLEVERGDHLAELRRGEETLEEDIFEGIYDESRVEHRKTAIGLLDFGIDLSDIHS